MKLNKKICQSGILIADIMILSGILAATSYFLIEYNMSQQKSIRQFEFKLEAEFIKTEIESYMNDIDVCSTMLNESVKINNPIGINKRRVYVVKKKIGVNTISTTGYDFKNCKNNCSIDLGKKDSTLTDKGLPFIPGMSIRDMYFVIESNPSSGFSTKSKFAIQFSKKAGMIYNEQEYTLTFPLAINTKDNKCVTYRQDIMKKVCDMIGGTYNIQVDEYCRDIIFNTNITAIVDLVVNKNIKGKQELIINKKTKLGELEITQNKKATLERSLTANTTNINNTLTVEGTSDFSGEKNVINTGKTATVTGNLIIKSSILVEKDKTNLGRINIKEKQ